MQCAHTFIQSLYSCRLRHSHPGYIASEYYRDCNISTCSQELTGTDTVSLMSLSSSLLCEVSANILQDVITPLAISKWCALEVCSCELLSSHRSNAVIVAAIQCVYDHFVTFSELLYSKKDFPDNVSSSGLCQSLLQRNVPHGLQHSTEFS